jgi:hypothetical protein
MSGVGAKPPPIPYFLRWAHKFTQAGSLRRDRNFWQYIHSANLRRHAKLLARSLFYSQNSGMAAHPAPAPGGKLGRKDQNQLQVRALYYPRLGEEEHSACAHVPSLGVEFGILATSDAHGQARNHSLAGASIDLRIHLFLICGSQSSRNDRASGKSERQRKFFPFRWR